MIWELRGRTLHFGDQVQIMGVLNATPDSFYDGGRYCEPQAAVERGLEMVEEGAAIVDIGGESSRPPMYGVAEEVSVAEECARVLPVVEDLRRQSAVPISVDTVKAEVARRALEVGADIINDISALQHDPAMAEVAAQAKAPVVLMHRRGTAATMQQNTHYDDLLGIGVRLSTRARTRRPCSRRRARGRGSGLGVWQVTGGQPRLVGDVRALLGLRVPVGGGCFAQILYLEGARALGCRELGGQLGGGSASG